MTAIIIQDPDHQLVGVATSIRRAKILARKDYKKKKRHWDENRCPSDVYFEMLEYIDDVWMDSLFYYPQTDELEDGIKKCPLQPKIGESVC